MGVTIPGPPWGTIPQLTHTPVNLEKSSKFLALSHKNTENTQKDLEGFPLSFSLPTLDFQQMFGIIANVK